MTDTSFNDRVRKMLTGFTVTGVMDRFAANDMLLDLLDAAGNNDEEAAVMEALASLPRSGLVDRAEVAALLTGLCPSRN